VRLRDGTVVRVLPDGTTRAFSATDGLTVEQAEAVLAWGRLIKTGTAVLAGFGCAHPEKITAQLRPRSGDSEEVIKQKQDILGAIGITATLCSGQIPIDAARRSRHP
jgi:hypothetical protein